MRPGDVQRMTAGTGIRHAEFNASKTDPVHFLQIWILPDKQGLEPGYEQRTFTDLGDGFRLVGSRAGRDGSLTVHRDVDMYAARLELGQTAAMAIKDDDKAWLQVTSGDVQLGTLTLGKGDGVSLTDEQALSITALSAAEVVLFDMA